MCSPLPGCWAVAVSCSSGQSRGQHSSLQHSTAGGMSNRLVIISAYSIVMGLSGLSPFPSQEAYMHFFHNRSLVSVMVWVCKISQRLVPGMLAP